MTLSIEQGTPALAELVDADERLTLLGSGFVFTEGPVWNPREQVLRFSDIPASTRYRWSERAGVEVDHEPTNKANGMFYEPDGSLLVCEHETSSLVRYPPGGERQVVADLHDGMELNSPNDVVVRSDGTIYFSDPHYGRMAHPTGAGREPSPLGYQTVFRIPPGGALQVAVDPDQIGQPNGLCFSPDERILYVDDATGIRAFDVAADGSLGPARIVREAMDGLRGADYRGSPDGLRCDERGNLWCAGVGGVWVVSPAGDLLGIISMPEICANLVWGGEDHHTLFLCVSTSVHALRTLVGPAPIPYR